MTSRGVESPAPAATNGKIAFGLAAGPALWAFHLAITYGLSSLACQMGFLAGSTLLGQDALTLILLLLTIAAAAGIVYSGLVAFRAWQVLRDGRRDGIGQPEEGRQKFLAFLGIMMAVLFGAAVLVTAFPILVLSPCG